MEQAKKTKLVVVLGMHRSGTSTIARGLNVLGVELGNNLAPGVAFDNEKGFFEDLDIVAINEEVLQLLGYDWDVIGRIPRANFLNTELSAVREKAITLLKSKIQNTELFGFKDPRTSRLLPFWIPIFKDLKLDVRYIIALRNPKSVADSLQRREGFMPIKSYWLWLSYIASSILDSYGKAIIVNYDNLIDQSFTELGRVANYLELPLPEFDSPSFNEYQSNFLDPKLRHTKYSLKEFVPSPSLSILVVEAFDKLRSLESNSNATLDPEIINWFVKATEHLLQEDKSYYRIDEKRKEAIAERDNIIAQRDAVVADRDSIIEQRDAVVADRDSIIEQRDAVVADRDSIIEQRDVAVACNIFLKNTRSWRLTRPLRFMARLVRHGFIAEDRQRLTHTMRQYYHRLPLPAPAKQLVSFACHKVIGNAARSLYQIALKFIRK